MASLMKIELILMKGRQLIISLLYWSAQRLLPDFLRNDVWGVIRLNVCFEATSFYDSF